MERPRIVKGKRRLIHCQEVTEYEFEATGFENSEIGGCGNTRGLSDRVYSLARRSNINLADTDYSHVTPSGESRNGSFYPIERLSEEETNEFFQRLHFKLIDSRVM